jgi:hypothetical protein
MSAKRKLLLGLSIISIVMHSPALVTQIYQSIEIFIISLKFDAHLYENQRLWSKLPDPSGIDQQTLEYQQYMIQLEELSQFNEAMIRKNEYQR